MAKKKPAPKSDPTVARGPGRPPKKRKPKQEYVVTYLASTSGGTLPKARRVFATDPGEAVLEAHKLNKIQHTHQFKYRVDPVKPPVDGAVDEPVVGLDGETVADVAENADDFATDGDL
jgi:hypothetical protein